MATKLKVYVNEDDALLFWSIAAPIPECRGFAIERKKNGVLDTLPNRVAFANDKDHGEAEVGAKGILKPSTELPFQRFSWTDHAAGTGDVVSYRVVPMIRKGKKLEMLESHASDFSEEKTLAPGTGPFKAFFNRGFVMSQFVSRFLAENNLSLSQFKKRIAQESDTTIRTFLSGDLRLALLQQLQLAKKGKGEVFAVLFELADEELLAALAALGSKAHVVLANGSITAKKGEGSAAARLRDENEDGRARLEDEGVDVEPKNRFLSPGALGHNKFLVRTDKKGRPISVWTGSTNWAPTGLCTQVNNGLLADDPEVAQIYLDQWHRLRKAASTFPAVLTASNSEAKSVGIDAPGNIRSAVWFTRTAKGVDLEALTEEVKKAREGILFLMFMPGAAGLFSTVAARSTEPNLYVRGVVSELPNGRGDESAVDVNLIDGANHTPLHLDIIQPEGADNQSMANFVDEVTHKQFLGGVGHAIIHSKVVVLDPFSSDPVVITGSHNFSSSASSKNDENFIIIKGDHALAEAYAVNIMGAYAHYRWRAFLSKTKKPFNGLRDDDGWQAPKLAAERRELRFWGV
jgi:PLD-like domain